MFGIPAPTVLRLRFNKYLVLNLTFYKHFDRDKASKISIMGEQ